ncbi:peptidoglycan-binding domain-containing protein [Nocardia sp. NPDC002869]|uniref:peptidoglycan-binding domain-containing protein n=1 Tax=Nocardia sp. NPDC002869 TaxID=3161032 RepID=UPI00398C8A54
MSQKMASGAARALVAAALAVGVATAAGALAQATPYTAVADAAVSKCAEEGPILAMGSTGTCVDTVQGVLGVKVDGIYGSATVEAVRRFQRDAGLRDDGMVGPETWAALDTQFGG